MKNLKKICLKARWSNITHKSSFSLAELLVTVTVAILVLGGVLISMISAMMLNEANEKFSIAMNIARNKLEDIFSRRTDFDTIIDAVGCLDFDSDGNDLDCTPNPELSKGMYRIDVTDVTSDLKEIKIAICWRGRGTKIIGDCQDVAIPPESGDLQWVAPFSSPCVLETAIARR